MNDFPSFRLYQNIDVRIYFWLGSLRSSPLEYIVIIYTANAQDELNKSVRSQCQTTKDCITVEALFQTLE